MNHFEKYFNKNIKYVESLNNDLKMFYSEMDKISDLRLQFKKIKKFFKILKIADKQDFGECVKYAVKKFNKSYTYNINNILKCYPPDHINKETGMKFWTGSKIMPHPLVFNINDKGCFGFIKSFACLLADCLSIDKKSIDIDIYIKEFLKNYEAKRPKELIFENKAYYEEKIKKLKDDINLYLKNDRAKLNFIFKKYEKDTIDMNEIDYIYYSSILRAQNYNLSQLDKSKIKIIAGKIVPALITSTACISGLLSMQLYVICQNSNYKNFRTGIIDLSDNTLCLGIPLEIAK